MNNIASRDDAEIPAYGAGRTLKRVRGAKHAAALLDYVLTLPNHRDHWATAEEVYESAKKGAGAEVRVMVGGHLLRGHDLGERAQEMGLAGGYSTLAGSWLLTRPSSPLTSFMATSLYPRFSKRAMMSPTRPRCTPSGWGRAGGQRRVSRQPLGKKSNATAARHYYTP